MRQIADLRFLTQTFFCGLRICDLLAQFFCGLNTSANPQNQLINIGLKCDILLCTKEILVKDTSFWTILRGEICFGTFL
jgi:hypothetical protein